MFILFLHVWVFCIHVLCALHPFLVAEESKEGLGSPWIRAMDGWSWGYQHLITFTSVTIQVLGDETRCSARATSAFHCQAVSPAPLLILYVVQRFCHILWIGLLCCPSTVYWKTVLSHTEFYWLLFWKLVAHVSNHLFQILSACALLYMSMLMPLLRCHHHSFEI